MASYIPTKETLKEREYDKEITPPDGLLIGVYHPTPASRRRRREGLRISEYEPEDAPC